MFPGQGNQFPGMLRDVSPKLIAKVKDLTGFDLPDDEEAYQDPVQIQLALLVLQLNDVSLLKEAGETPDIVGGHSLGIFAAAVCSGVLSEDDAIKLVLKRATLMKNAYPEGYGMGVIVGLTRIEVENLTEKVNSKQTPVFTSNQNAELQVSLSGSYEGIDQVLELAKKQSARTAKRLAVPSPSHSPLMKAAAQELERYVEGLNLQDANCVYLTNFNGHAVTKAEEIAYDLSHNLMYPVYWDTMAEVALELGTEVSVELEPGQTFTKLMKQKTSDIQNISLATMSIDDVSFLLNKWKRGFSNG